MGKLINGRTPEEIKAAVLCTERGTIPDCENCPYCGAVDEQGFRSFACYQASFDVIAYVERLEAKLARRDALLAEMGVRIPEEETNETTD